MDAKTVIQFRLTHKLTQQELGDLVGLSKAMISKIEAKIHHMPAYASQALWTLIDEHGINRDIDAKPGEIHRVAGYKVQDKLNGSTAYSIAKEREVVATVEEKVLPPASEHYHQTELDPIGLGEKLFSKEKMLGFYQVNLIKYISRYGIKGGFNEDDLNKTQYYLDKIRELKLDDMGENNR